MTFNAYIQIQKRRIRESHAGEEFLIVGGEQTPVRCTEQVLKEMDGLKGLNIKERAFFAKRREASFAV